MSLTRVEEVRSVMLVSDDGQVSLDDVPGTVFELIDELGVAAPEYEKLRAGYYGTLTMSSAQVAEFARETREVRDRYQTKKRNEVVKQRRIRARDPQVVDRAVAQILSGDPWLAKFGQLVTFCEKVIKRAGTITCVGD